MAVTIDLTPALAAIVEERGGADWVRSLITMAIGGELRKCENCRQAKSLESYGSNPKLCLDCLRRMDAAMMARAPAVTSTPEKAKAEPEVPDGSFRCAVCGQVKEQDAFPVDKSRGGRGRLYRCKECSNKRSREYYLANQAKLQERARLRKARKDQ